MIIVNVTDSWISRRARNRRKSQAAFTAELWEKETIYQYFRRDVSMTDDIVIDTPLFFPTLLPALFADDNSPALVYSLHESFGKFRAVVRVHLAAKRRERGETGRIPIDPAKSPKSSLSRGIKETHDGRTILLCLYAAAASGGDGEFRVYNPGDPHSSPQWFLRVCCDAREGRGGKERSLSENLRELLR